MGINIKTNTNKKATLKMLNSLTTYLFEQEFGDLDSATSEQINTLKKAKQVLADLL